MAFITTVRLSPNDIFPRICWGFRPFVLIKVLDELKFMEVSMHRWYVGFLTALMLLLISCNQSYSELEAQAGSWQLLGLPQGNTLDALGPIPSMALNSLGNPGIAYYNPSGPFSPPSFAYHDGTAWIGNSNLDFRNYNVYHSIGGIDVAFDTQNRPVVAFTKWFAGIGGFVYVKRLNAATGRWKEYEVIGGLTQYPDKIKIKLSNNLPVIAYTTFSGGNGTLHVKRLSCTTCFSWVSLGTPESSNGTFSLDLDNLKNPVIANNNQVKKWDNTQAQWVLVGSALPSTLGGIITMNVNAQGNPIVVLQKPNSLTNYSTDVYARRWDGSAWQPLGNIVTNNARVYAVNMTLDGEGNPYVIWQNEYDLALYVKHWKAPENRWRFVGPNPISNVSGYKVGNIPTIAWRNNSLVATWRRAYLNLGGISYSGGIFSKRYIP